MMNERQQIVCAIALFADGHSFEQIAEALDVPRERAVELIHNGADEQRRGTMGYMKNCPAGEDKVVAQRNNDGNPTRTAKRA